MCGSKTPLHGNMQLIKLSNEIRSNYAGFDVLVNFAAQLKLREFEHIEVDMSGVQWMDANMCAPLGGILYKLSRQLNTVTLTGLKSGLEEILSKNGFLSNYGREKKQDRHGTTIEYKRFEPKDGRYFGSYIETHLKGKGIPQMSSALLKKFRESIFEIFSNAVIHSETKLGIFSCGQFFPSKHRLDFSIADLGLGIQENLKQKANLELSAVEAINWAMKGRNTTKKGPIPGGLGLKLLRDFIEINKGRIQIVSDLAYWEFTEGAVSTKEFSTPFTGTAVNIEINTADTQSYCLASELRPENVF